MKPKEGCVHGEIETSIAHGSITCRLCGESATLRRYYKAKQHKHKKEIFAGNGRALYFCRDNDCGWEQEYKYP